MKQIALSILCLFSLLSCNKDRSKESIKSVLVSKDGEVVQETYFNGSSAEEIANVQSLTKSIMSILVGIAIDKKMIKNEDETIEQYFQEEWPNVEGENKKTITIKHLLNQTSGLEWEGYLEHEDWLAVKNPTRYVLGKKMVYDPGVHYNYNSGATHLLSVILTKATGQSTLDFAKENLFDPLQIKNVKWEKRNGGYYDGSGMGLSMSPKDLLLIGQCLLGLGNIEGNTIISKEWIGKMFDEKAKSKTNWGIRKSTHGFCWYKSAINGQEVNYGMGYGGQFLFLIPAKNLVVVVTHNHDTPDGIDQQVDYLANGFPELLQQY